MQCGISTPRRRVAVDATVQCRQLIADLAQGFYTQVFPVSRVHLHFLCIKSPAFSRR